jgi:hypothetical protein
MAQTAAIAAATAAAGVLIGQLNSSVLRPHIQASSVQAKYPRAPGPTRMLRLLRGPSRGGTGLAALRAIALDLSGQSIDRS